MASISKRFTASGDARYDVRYRAGGRAVEETFKRRLDADNRVRQIEAEKLRGQVVDPRRGREKLTNFAERWLEARTAKGKPLTPMTNQGYGGLLAGTSSRASASTRSPTSRPQLSVTGTRR